MASTAVVAWVLWAAAVSTGVTTVNAQVEMTEVDYVIVGGGTAGCVLAARLCEGLPQAKIAMVERAPPRSEEAELAVRAMRNFFGGVNKDTPEVSEPFDSEPNTGLDGKVLQIYTGRTLGGSSAINGGQFSAPANEVPASWGVAGLDATTSERLYNKVRNQLGVAQPPPELRQSYIAEWLAANAAAGVNVIEPPTIPTGAGNDSIWVSYLTVDDKGRRMDSARGYLEPVLGPSGVCADNLQLIQGATASKLILKEGQAVGVEYQTERGGPAKAVLASKETLLTAGPYHSAKLLQLSGVGPAPLLESFGIEVLADLPVGTSAQARAYGQILNIYTGMPLSKGGNNTEAESEEAKQQFLAGEGGILGFTRSQMNGIWGSAAGSWRTMSFIGQGPGDDPRKHRAGCIPNPTSRSTVVLNSTDAFDPPKVDLNILGESEEAEGLLSCLDREREVVAQMPASFGMNETSSSVTVEEVRKSTSNGNHFVGACALGTVLDPEMKVIGFSNLRVVDASAIPDMPPWSGPAGSVYMLAEHISEQIIASGVGAYGPSAGPTEAPLIAPARALNELGSTDELKLSEDEPGSEFPVETPALSVANKASNVLLAVVAGGLAAAALMY